MKTTLIQFLSVAFLLTSCASKKNDEILIPPTPINTNTVTIGGSAYPTVNIGTQTWTTVNYNGAGGVNYNASATNNATYGKLYLLTEAKAISLPTGWRLPSREDAEKLLLYVGAVRTVTQQVGLEVQGGASASIKLKSKADWTHTQGSNATGFNAYPSGQSTGTSSYTGKNEIAAFWTSTAMPSQDNLSQFTFGLWNQSSGQVVLDDVGIDYSPKSNQARLSLRFVKDN